MAGSRFVLSAGVSVVLLVLCCCDYWTLRSGSGLNDNKLNQDINIKLLMRNGMIIYQRNILVFHATRFVSLNR